jgi:hypothetical protein
VTRVLGFNKKSTAKDPELEAAVRARWEQDFAYVGLEKAAASTLIAFASASSDSGLDTLAKMYPPRRLEPETATKALDHSVIE